MAEKDNGVVTSEGDGGDAINAASIPIWMR